MAQAAAAREQAVAEAAGEGAGVEAVAALRAALPKPVDLGKLVPLVDVSGSMTGVPMEVAVGLGLVVSELAHPSFRNRVLTFSARPEWVTLEEGASVVQKVRQLKAAPWGCNTDFEAACERILDAAQRAKLKPDEVPDLIVFSDMQFDQARSSGYYGGGWCGASPRWVSRCAARRTRRRASSTGTCVATRWASRSTPRRPTRR